MSNSRFSIVVPGREIPEWFMCQNNGSSITHGWPSYKYKKNKVLEYCICRVFRVHNHPPPARGRIHLSTYQLKFRTKDVGYVIDFGKKFGQCGSYHSGYSIFLFNTAMTRFGILNQILLSCHFGLTRAQDWR